MPGTKLPDRVRLVGSREKDDGWCDAATPDDDDGEGVGTADQYAIDDVCDGIGDGFGEGETEAWYPLNWSMSGFG